MVQRRIDLRWGAGFITATLGIAALLSGCGGGGGASSPGGVAGPSGGSQTANVGMAQITYIGQPKPASVESSGTVSFYGEAGASFTSLTVDPTPSLTPTSLLFTRALQSGDQTYFMPAAQAGNPTLIARASLSGYPSCSKAGLIAYLTYLNGNYEIVTSYQDGSHYKVVTDANAFPAISPSGATIVYVNANDHNIYSIPAAGGTATEIYNGGNAYLSMPVWSPTGNLIAFSAPNVTTTTDTDVYTMAPTGGTTTDISGGLAGTGTLTASSWSPDGNSIACTYKATSATTTSAVLVSVGGGLGSVFLTTAGYNDSSPAIAPDNLHVAFYRTNASGAVPGIYESDLVGTNPYLVLGDPATSGDSGPVSSLTWTSYLENEKFVGSGSTLSDAAVSGLLLTQNGSQFASLMVFAAATPSTATLTPESIGSNGGPSIFKLAANGITIISYANTYNGAQTFLPLSSTTAALVTLDGVTGFIDLVAPGAFSKKQPMTTSSGRSTFVYSGKFSGIYDGTGKNLAPMGASTLQIDAKTGKLVSFQ